ncbi:hypothetical protein Tco_1086851, partial [Tanacetum coccineum]
QQLKFELAGYRQEGLSIVSYYGKLKVIWDELINYEQFPLCKCGKCVCDIAGKLEKKREEERVHQFFMGLEDKTYGQTRSNLLTMDPLPTRSNLLVRLPNGDQDVATKSGIVNLDRKIKLDYTSRIQIGAGELREGLYYFCSAASASALKKLKDVLFDLWHKSLGHPSAKIVELLPNVGSRSTSNLVNKGGYHTLSSCSASYILTIVDDYSRAVWIDLLKNKTEAPLKLLNFFALVER